jgi:hypothetical protein
MALVILAIMSVGCDGPRDRSAERVDATGRSGSEGGMSALECTGDPVPRSRPEVSAVAFARGDGPVFVGLGTPRVVHYTEDTRQDAGWFYYKTLWAVSPKYSGPVTITGRELEGTEVLRFNPAAGFPGKKLTSLHLPPSEEGGWRYAPSETLIRAPGCYVLEIRGAGFTEFVTFQARP